MAKGDTIIGELNNGACQPAAGVEICITTVSNTPAGGASIWNYYDGAVKGEFASPGINSTTLSDEVNVHVWFTNSLYIQTSHNATYSGIQVK